MADDRLKSFIGAAFDLEMRARDVIDARAGAKALRCRTYTTRGARRDALRQGRSC
jgi:hypothetical protein